MYVRGKEGVRHIGAGVRQSRLGLLLRREEIGGDELDARVDPVVRQLPARRDDDFRPGGEDVRFSSLGD